MHRREQALLAQPPSPGSSGRGDPPARRDDARHLAAEHAEIAEANPGSPETWLLARR